MLSLQCFRIMVELMREFEMTYNDITSSELDNLRIALKIENFKSKKQKTLTEIIERELALASEGKSKFISQKYKALSESCIIPVETIAVAEPIKLFKASSLGTTVVVTSTFNDEPHSYTIVSDSKYVDAGNNVISYSSPLGSRLADAKVEDMIGYGDDFYQVIDIIPMLAEATM